MKKTLLTSGHFGRLHELDEPLRGPLRLEAQREGVVEEGRAQVEDLVPPHDVVQGVHDVAQVVRAAGRIASQNQSGRPVDVGGKIEAVQVGQVAVVGRMIGRSGVG